jgi:trehalose-6-phosphate hydrolase
MTNPGFDRIEQYRDVESLNIFRLKRDAGEPEASSMAAIMQKSRDNGRTPMQWNAGENAGFSTGEPWIGIPANAAQHRGGSRAGKWKRAIIYMHPVGLNVKL